MASPILQSSAVQPLIFFIYASSDHVSGLTGATPTVRLGKNGGTGASPAGSVSEIDSTNLPGYYKVAPNATDSNTLGPLILSATAVGGDQATMLYDIVAFNPQSATNLGLSNLDTTVSSRLATSGYTAPDNTSITAIKAKTDNLPTAPASTTNITGGTITTVTNLTNAATAGDFTGTMKSSITSAVPTAAANAAATRDVNNTSPAASSLGAAVNSAASAGDPWATAIPGAYGAGTAGNIVGNNLDAAVSDTATPADVPTANNNADALLKRDWTSITGEAARSVLNALRFIRNGFSTSGTTLSVLKEDDSTVAYTRTVTTDPSAEPIVGVD